MPILVISIFTACFTWCIAWAYIKILFVPKTPKRLFGIQWENALTQMIKNLPIDRLIEENKTSAFRTLLPFIDQELDSFFKERLVQKMPIISMFIGEKTVGELKWVFMQELEQLFPTLLEKLTAQNVEDLHKKMSHSLLKTLELKLLFATRSIRWVALGWGIIWGLLIAFILPHF